MQIAAIIVTYNGAKWIAECLTSLIKSNVPIKIYIIDNGSTDNTIDIIRAGFKDVKIFEVNENLGFGKANNIGIAKALKWNADYMLLLNQDARIETNTVLDLIEIQNKNNEFGILCPLQLNGKGDKIDSLFLQYTVGVTIDLINDYFLGRNKKEVYEVSFANAACWLIPNEVIKNIGGFDPLFDHYGEDDDYVLRCKRKNYKIGICPNQKVFHDREFRVNIRTSPQIINDMYIDYILALKNPNVSISRYFYVKKLVQAGLMYFLTPNKRHYKNQLKAILKVLKVYKTAVNNSIEEDKTVGAHYLI